MGDWAIFKVLLLELGPPLAAVGLEGDFGVAFLLAIGLLSFFATGLETF